MRVTVIAEYYPRPDDPVLGVWAHRQAVAARDAGADVRVLVLDRPIPGAATVKEAARGRPGKLAHAVRAAASRPSTVSLDGIQVEYVRYMSPPRSRSYARWHRYARKPLARALDRGPRPDLIHAHYAHLAGAAAMPWAEANGIPLVVSVHGGDVMVPGVADVSASTLQQAALVMCNSHGTLTRAAALAGSEDRMRVVHLGTDIPSDDDLRPKYPRPTIATVANVDPRKRHEDVLRALGELPPQYRWMVIGDGPHLRSIERLAGELGLTSRVVFAGRLSPRETHAELARSHVMALPSEDEAFGVAYIEALAHGVPAIGLEGEDGPEEIAALAVGNARPGGAADAAGTQPSRAEPARADPSRAEPSRAEPGRAEPGRAGPGRAERGDAKPMLLVPARDPTALARAIEHAVGDDRLPTRARELAREHFTWERCGRATVAAYEAVLSP